MDRATVRMIVEAARREGRDLLPEPEAFQVVAALGLAVPGMIRLERFARPCAGDLDELSGDRAVLKIVSRGLAHKSEVGGVRVVPRTPEGIGKAMAEMLAGPAGGSAEGFLLQELVPYSPAFGEELLVNLRWNQEFGPIVTLGPGGIHAELLSRSLRPGRDLFVASPMMMSDAGNAAGLDAVAVVEAATKGQRGRPPLLSRAAVHELLLRLLAASEALIGELLAEVEVNPLVVSEGEMVALDAFVRVAEEPPVEPEPRPLEKIGRLLRPRSLAVIGASRGMNPGRLILRNVLREGFDPAKVLVVKEGLEELDGCRCVPRVSSLPERVDLLIVSVAAQRVPEVLVEVIGGRKAESVIVIPGGLEEKEGGEEIARELRSALSRSRRSSWRGPILNGGNCLGIRSRPGRYDTLFLPEHKLPSGGREPAGAVMLSQSGAFLAAKTSRLLPVRFEYAVSLGNQTDLTVGDYMTYLADDAGLDLFAVYVEGFRPGDGPRFLAAARRIRQRGGRVVLYRAGRSPRGAAAASSHTAAVAGDYAVTRALARSAGVVVADSIPDFEDLVTLFSALEGREPAGRRLAAVSNAGFECVAMADRLGGFEASTFSPATLEELRRIFRRSRIDQVVDVRNPLDLTPMMDDAAYEEVVRAVLEDEAVDAAVIGCVPLTGALETLAAGAHHSEDVHHAGSVASRLARLHRESRKPWIVVVDGGADYDAMADLLRSSGVPVFRSADRALRLFDAFCSSRLGDPGRSSQG